MKTITFTSPREFDNFRKLANFMNIFFVFTISHGSMIVEAKAHELEGLGY